MYVYMCHALACSLSIPCPSQPPSPSLSLILFLSSPLPPLSCFLFPLFPLSPPPPPPLYRETGPRCPVDNTTVCVHQLFKDNFAKREVLSLNVHCSADQCGCPWQGELRDLQVSLVLPSVHIIFFENSNLLHTCICGVCVCVNVALVYTVGPH